MIGSAAVAAKETAVASALGVSLLPGVAPSAVDGFAAGTLLTGVCFLLIKEAPRRLRRHHQRAEERRRASAAPVGDLSASEFRDLRASEFGDLHAVEFGDLGAGEFGDLYADEAAEMLVSAAGPTRYQIPLPADEFTGRPSSHRAHGHSAGTWRPDGRRAGGRHAAPGMSSRLASKFPYHPIAVRD